MARGISRKDFKYEVEVFDEGVAEIQALMLISMDEYNVGTDATLINESTSVTAPFIEAHIKLDKNEKEYGIHPRHAVCEYSSGGSASACNGTNPKRFVTIPILTIAQFAALNPYDEVAGGTQPNTTLEINHSFDGTARLIYKIRKLVPEVKI